MRGVLLDLDGVLYVGDEPLPGAAGVVDWLAREGVPYRYLTNTTSRPRRAIVDTLTGMGITAAPDQVLTPAGRGWDFATLNRAFRLLMSDAAPPLVALGLTRYWRADDGLRLDAGPFVRALEYATGRTAVVLGKPDPAFYDGAVEDLDLEPGQVVMVGDDVRSDVEGAQRAGLTGVLVCTGKFSPPDLDGDVSPDAVLDSIADLPRWWAEP